MKKRTLSEHLSNFLFLYGKMIFISGPRQVGKTTMVADFLEKRGGGVYFNWDILTDRKKMASNPYFFEEENRTPDNIVVLDEIHKYKRWKSYLKGAYDKYKDDFHFIITGSGRLDLFNKGGDSLLGRYITLPLFPFTLSEMNEKFCDFAKFREGLSNDYSFTPNRDHYDALFEFGGFPDPLLKASKNFYNIWQQERKTLLVREDIRDTTNIRDLSLLEMLSNLIAQRIGSPLSINSLREDIGVAFETVRDWINILSQFYYLFQLSPYSGSLKRTLRKEKKAYLFDWGEIDDVGVRFENFVAMHLLKATKTWKSLGEAKTNLSYIRDKEKREVDFLITENNKPLCLIETKSTDENLSDSLLHYQHKLKVPVAVQLVHKSGVEKKMRKNDYIQHVISADKWLYCLP